MSVYRKKLNSNTNDSFTVVDSNSIFESLGHYFEAAEKIFSDIFSIIVLF